MNFTFCKVIAGLTLYGGVVFGASAEEFLFYSSKTTDNANSIYRMQPENLKQTLYMRHSVANRGEEAIDFSPSSHQVVFGTYRFGGWKLAIADYDNEAPFELSNVRKLTQNGTYKYQPRLSPDGNLVAYRNYYTQSPPRFSGGDDEIFIYNIKSSINTNITNSAGPDVMPVWSPDQKQILFSSDRKMDGLLNYDLYTIDMQSMRQTPLVTSNKASEFGASYSKDGSAIAFLRLKDNVLSLLMVKADGAQVQNLSDGIVKDGRFRGPKDLLHYGYNTSWSPNGKQIAFVGHWESDREIYLYDIEHKSMQKLTDNQIDEYYVNWVTL